MVTTNFNRATFIFANARQLIMKPKGAVKTIIDNNKIKEINVGDETIVQLGDIIEIKFTGEKIVPFRVNQITLSDENKTIFILNTAPRTKSSIFLLPAFTGSSKLFDWNGFYVNTYLYVDNVQSFDDLTVYHLYRYSNSTRFSMLEQFMISHQNYVKTIDIDGYHVMYEFKLPDNNTSNMLNFKEGVYSRLTNNLKKRILQFHNFKQDGDLGGVLYKHKTRILKLENMLGIKLPKDSELWDKPNITEIETLNPKTL